MASLGNTQAEDAFFSASSSAAPNASSSCELIAFCIPSKSWRSSLRMCCGSFSANVPQALQTEAATARAGEIFAKKIVLGEKFLHQRPQLLKSRRRRKQFLLFRREMDPNLHFKLLRDFGLPSLQVNLSGLNRTVQPYAQRQRVLMLPRKRDEVFITQHAN